MFRNCLYAVIGLILLGLAGCASKPVIPPSERIILLPGADGKVGELVVTANSGNEVRLNQAYGSASVQGSSVQFSQSSSAEVEERYRATLAAIPTGSRSYVLYFAFEKATLLPNSQATLDAILDDFRKRPSPEIIIIGHTDKAGDSKYNEDLSQRRARTVRNLLIGKGVSANIIEMAWRGDREPLPETAGKTSDQRNRRVEVKVR
jgi:outer membrane protein OmpA-like peptidoglycan-associated protein